MGRNNYFQFKQFKILQEKAAMKVGTDAVLLGAWADATHAANILDVGTGTGLIAIMLAQRSSAKIVGIEIEKYAAREAGFNTQNSPWSKRVSIKNVSFQKFAETNISTFDLIVSNPPFFINNTKTQNPNRTIARHNDLLPLSDLVNSSAILLESSGKLAIILPVFEAEKFIRLAKNKGFYLTRLTEVKSNQQKNTHRYLMEFSKKNSDFKKDILTIYNEKGSDYSVLYKKLTRDFYLNF